MLPSLSLAGVGKDNYPQLMSETLVGYIRDIKLNTVMIEDERDKSVRSFRYVRINDDSWHIGDKVRVYYSSDGVVENMIKVRVVEYHKDGQNAGYLLK